jgi:hypothetical protein
MTDAAKPEAGLDDFSRSPETVLREGFAAAVHELSERLTAATNYVAAASRLFELATPDKGGCSETLQKALAQLDRAGDVVHVLRKLLQEQRS